MTRTSAGLIIHTLETPGLGDRSYLAILDGVAVAVDVQRDLDRVEEILQAERATLGAVLETHIHNDYLTGGLVLARRFGAEYVVPAGPRLGYSATRAADGTAIELGAMTFRTIDSPGHTDAHAAYSVHVDGGAAAAAFTGGSLLFGATGRSDLLGRDRADALARQQYWSVRRMARILGGDARIFPTHGFGSFCVAGSPVGAGDTVAEQLAVNPAYLLSEDEFVEDMLSKLDAYPAYYAFMGPRNAGGVDTAELPELRLVSTDDLAESSARVVDVRPREDWATSHLPGSLSVDFRGAMATWLGWLVPIDEPVALVAGSLADAYEAQRELHRIGFDGISAVHVPQAHERLGTAATKTATFADLAAAQQAGEVPFVLDVRELSEWRTGHLAGALHVSAHDIDATFADALPLGTPWIHCAAGFRAAIAASQFETLGASAVIVNDTLADADGLAWCVGTDCTDSFCCAGVVPAVTVAG